MIAVKIKTIIIEDDIKSQEYLKSILEKKFKIIDIIGASQSISDSIKLINSLEPELIFMDIKLTDGNSFEIFNQLNHTNFEVIFVTAFDNFMQKAIDHYALSYIIKPIDKLKLIDIVKRYINKRERLFSQGKIQSLTSFIDHKNPKLLIHTGDEYVSIKTKAIVKCEADGNYTSIYLKDKTIHLASNNLKYYENLLIDKGFFKPHRSILINTHFIKSIFKKETIVLTTDEKIHVSVRNKSKLTELINLLS